MEGHRGVGALLYSELSVSRRHPLRRPPRTLEKQHLSSKTRKMFSVWIEHQSALAVASAD